MKGLDCMLESVDFLFQAKSGSVALNLAMFLKINQALKWKHELPEKSFFRWETIYKKD